MSSGNNDSSKLDFASPLLNCAAALAASLRCENQSYHSDASRSAKLLNSFLPSSPSMISLSRRRCHAVELPESVVAIMSSNSYTVLIPNCLYHFSIALAASLYVFVRKSLVTSTPCSTLFHASSSSFSLFSPLSFL